MTKLSHFDDSGQAHMVNIVDKKETKRQAVATGKIKMSKDTFQLLEFNASHKGDVLGIARIAAIQGTKLTSNLIPLCHPLSLTHVSVDFTKDIKNYCLVITVTVETFGKTGVEMEALCGVSAGLLTVYDMLKAVEKSMIISDIYLLQKVGGKSGKFEFS